MVGDLVALMLDESLGISTDYAIIEHDIHSYTAGYVLDPRRTKLKKYWKSEIKNTHQKRPQLIDTIPVVFKMREIIG